MQGRITLDPLFEADTTTAVLNNAPVVTPAPLDEAAALVELLEAKDGTPTGSAWDVTVIKAGDSKSRRRYPAEVLRRALGLFEGAKVFADHPSRDELRARPERSVRDVIGWLAEARWDGAGQAIKATLHLTEAAGVLRQALVDAWQRGKTDLLGLSINVGADVLESSERGQRWQIVQQITHVGSVDLVTTPAAGGGFDGLLASDRADAADAEPETPAAAAPSPDPIPTTEAAPDAAGEADMAQITLDEIRGLIATALQEAREGTVQKEVDTKTDQMKDAASKETEPRQVPEKHSGDAPAGAGGIHQGSNEESRGAAVRESVGTLALTQSADLARAVARLERDATERRLRDALSLSKLPEPSQKRLLRMFEGQTAVADDALTTAIRDEREYLATLMPTKTQQFGVVRQGEGASVGMDPRDKFLSRMYGIFEGADVDKQPRFMTLKEAYYAFLGLKGEDDASFFSVNPTAIFEAMRPRGRGALDRSRSLYAVRVQEGMSLEEATHFQLRSIILGESLTTADWGQVFADVMYNRLVRAYNTDGLYNEWRTLASDVLSVPDFRTQHVTRLGGFADLASVAEGATYPLLTTPTDEEVTFAITKYGGLHDITMETVVNDNMAAIRRIPVAMARAAKRTLRNDVMQLITTSNPTMGYDTTALYASGHNNTGTTALSVAGLAAVTRAMRDQTAYNESALVLGEINKPKYLIVPNELEQLADRITGGTSNSYAYALSSTPDGDQSIDPRYFHGKGLGYLVYDELTDATDWWTMADPNLVPTLAVAFLNGNDQPEMFIQDNPTVGSNFTADKITTKVRIIWGRAVIDHRSFYREVVSG